MTGSGLWSVRMRASAHDNGAQRHLSGAERLVEEGEIDDVVAEMFARSKSKFPDLVQITAEAIGDEYLHRTNCLPVTTVRSLSSDQAAHFAVELLRRSGVNDIIAARALESLSIGLGEGGTSLRGASLWDKNTGRRLEPDMKRGVRTSRFDYSKEAAAAVDSALAQNDLHHFRTREALAVATKTLWAGIVAEMCWSDEPDYTTGYISSAATGYVRLPGFKPSGARGGRIFFTDALCTDIASIVRRLESDFVLIDPPITIKPPTTVNAYLEHL
jgi:6-carboxyhexanoate--CoA ligase